MPINYSKIGQLLLTYRVKNGVSQPEFGKMANIHVITVRKLEQGNSVSFETLHRVYKALGLKKTEIAELEGDGADLGFRPDEIAMLREMFARTVTNRRISTEAIQTLNSLDESDARVVQDLIARLKR